MRCLWLAAIGLLLCSRLPAPLIPGPNLAKRVEAADLILVGPLVGGTAFASGTQVSSDIVLEARRVLKGNLIPGNQVAAHLEGRSYFVVPKPAQAAIDQRIYGIWFLRADPARNQVISRDGQFGELHFAASILPENAPAGNAGASPAESVANEIAAGLRWLAETHAGPGRPLAAAYAGQFRSLTEDLASLGPSATQPVYREFAGDASPALRAAGIQGLVAAGDPDGVKRAAADWDQLAASADVQPLVMALMSYSNAADPQAVRALGALALRPEAVAGLRENAAYALRAIHTKESLPALAALLDEDAERVSSYALSGFCLFVRNAPPVTPQSVPSMSWMQSREPAPYLTPETERYCLMGGRPDPSRNKAEYVSFWKSWWAANRADLEVR